MNAKDVEWLHDLRMPLQLIASSAQMIKLAQTDATLDAAEYVDLLLDGVGQVQRLLAGVLDGQPRAVPARPVRRDLARCVKGLCLRCRPYADELGVSLSCSGNVASLDMLLDEDALSRVLLNLIANALRFTPRGGKIRVEWRAMGDFAEVTVADSGAGIPPERLPLIFLRGVTDGGHGYGLAIARDCARAMGGDITVRSRRGRGSAFTLRLPVRAGQPLAGAQ